MLNFYRHFLPHVATIQAPLHDALSGPKVKGSHPVTWNDTLVAAFNECKTSLSQATLLAHPDPTAPLALVTDASTTAMGAILQQWVQDVWQPLAFFFRKLSPAQQKYSAYDWELLAIYEAVTYFRHMLEARHFTILTDHKPLTFAFHQKRDKCSPRQFTHLDFVSQFTTDIRHISGQNNIVADALSQVEVVTAPVTHEALATAQKSDDEQHYSSKDSSSPAPQSSCTATPLLVNLAHTSHPLSAIRSSTPCIPSATQGLRQWLNSSPNTLCGQPFRRTVALGPELANPASAPKFPATPLLQLATSPSLLPAFYTSTLT